VPHNLSEGERAEWVAMISTVGRCIASEIIVFPAAGANMALWASDVLKAMGLLPCFFTDGKYAGRRVEVFKYTILY
jgi:hypothetical protein